MVNKKRIIIALFGLVAIGLFAVGIITAQRSAVGTKRVAATVYFLNPATERLEPETHYYEAMAKKDLVEALLNTLFSGPKSGLLTNPTPAGVRMLSGQLVNDSMLEMEFAGDYLELSPKEEINFRSALVWTMTSLDFIDDVHIYVAGQELMGDGGAVVGLLNRDNTVIELSLLSGSAQTQWVTLYFGNGNGLAAEERLIEVKDRPLEFYIVEQLIKGPTLYGLTPVIPPETVALDVKTDEGVCYVNLSGEFVTKLAGNETAQSLACYSIVNSLTKMSGVKLVQFLIQSEKVNEFADGFDISKPLAPEGSY